MSDGSVLFQAVAKDRGMGTNQDRGEWKQDGSFWYHDHQVNMPAKILRVNVLNGAGGGNCSDPEHDFDVREFTLAYTKVADGTTANVKVFIQAANTTAPGRLAIESAATPDAQIKFWLRVGAEGDKLTSVTFPSGPTCTLTAGKSELHVYQKITP